MKPSQRAWVTNEALGIASIFEVVTGCVYNLDQDIKGRWHVWSAPAMEPDHSDHVARQLEPESV